MIMVTRYAAWEISIHNFLHLHFLARKKYIF
jgi:hypothetical protein